MTQASDSASMSMKLGELTGRVGEVAHTVNNMSQKMDALMREIVETKGLASEVAELKLKNTALEHRISILEASENKRSGAMGFGNWLLGSRVIGLLIAAALSVLAYLEIKK